MKPQKALHKYKADEKKTKKYLGHQYLMLPKLDGWYGYIDTWNTLGICSNAQRIIPSCRSVSAILRDKFLRLQIMEGRLIFELTVDSEPQFELLNGILNRKEICSDVRINIHDFIPKGNCTMATMERYSIARGIVTELDLPFVSMINHMGSSDVPEVWESKAAQLIDKGMEGLILKRIDVGYSEGKRNEDLMKIKEECEFDLLCVGIQKGKPDGKYRNTLGALVLMDAVGKKFTVSGMSDGQRSEWFNSPEKIVHKVVKVKAKNVMKDGSLREPRFNVIRFDKNKDDIDVVK